MGCANQAGEDNRNVARMSALLAGLGTDVPGVTLNRLCGSGMDAIVQASRAIRVGEMDLAIGAGVESMSRAPFVMPKADTAFSQKNAVYNTTIGWRFVNRLMKAQYGVDSMPETAENVAEDYNISREDQDAFAVRSQQKAGDAMESGRLAQEIVAVEARVSRKETRIVDADEHPRPGTTAEVLAKLPAPFREGGTVTAGNASGVNDGAAAVLLASSPVQKRMALPRSRASWPQQSLVLNRGSWALVPRLPPLRR